MNRFRACTIEEDAPVIYQAVVPKIPTAVVLAVVVSYYSLVNIVSIWISASYLEFIPMIPMKDMPPFYERYTPLSYPLSRDSLLQVGLNGLDIHSKDGDKVQIV
jgi:hypothetical protein